MKPLGFPANADAAESLSFYDLDLTFSAVVWKRLEWNDVFL